MRCFFLSDLHLFSRRTDFGRYERVLEQAADRAVQSFWVVISLTLSGAAIHRSTRRSKKPWNGFRN